MLDLTRLLPGNYCTWLLRSLGADVVKVEDPGAGDYMRDLGVQVDGMSAPHHVVNRGKSSIVIDLKRAEGVETFLELVESADVVVDSFRPGVTSRLGIGWEALSARRPSIVVASITGFGTTGPLAQTAGHDLNYLAFAGLLDRLVPRSGPPVVPGVPLADLVGGGLVTAFGIVSLVLQARQTGTGGKLDSSIAESMALLPSLLLADLLGGREPKPAGSYEFDGGQACYGTYELSDGFVSVGAMEPRFWSVLCERIGRTDLVEAHADEERQPELRAVLEAKFRSMSKADVRETFDGSDACVFVVDSIAETLESDHATSRELVRPCEGSPIPVPVPPFVIDESRPPERGPAPRQGADTVRVLRAAGFDEERVAELISAGVVEQRD